MTRLARPLHGAPRLNGVRVLVVDDAPGVRGIVFDVLTRDGAKVTTVGTAEEALLALQREPATCSLSDVAMPGKGGSG